MQISTKLLSIFLFLLFLLFLAAMYPSPGMIFVIALFISAVVIYQTIVILKDEQEQ